MLTINAQPPRPKPTDHAGVPTANTDAAADPAGFSSMLRQTQTATAPSTATVPAAASAPAAVAPKADARAPHAPATHEADATPPRGDDATPPRGDDASPAVPGETPPTHAAGRGRTALKPGVRDKDTEPLEARPAVPNTDAALTTNAAATDSRATDASAASAAPPATLDPAVAHWLAAQQRTAPGEKPSARRETPDAVGRPADMAPAAAANGTKAGAPVDDAAPKDRTPRAAEAVTPAPAFVAVLAEQRASDHTTTHHADTRAEAVGAAAFAPAPAMTREAAPSVPLAIATPVTAPDFAQALGAQMSVLAKDGIQRAELHLNPAEMGPVSVQIVMDGTQARVDFGADMAATRHAIEAGLPELASALRDAGFTLAGGGVSQHAGGRGQSGRSDRGDDARRAVQRVSDEGVARVGAAAQRALTRGGLDLYA